ncbi:NUDIX domain-containing protein [Ktedonobacteria bacterium brp13]|nr:NUDIX domain-containing protein [Ktedonobacteria bacterium brp13]
MQYYALVAQEGTGKVLVFKKRTHGYFFNKGASGVIISEGGAIKAESGAGQWVFPGGGQEKEDSSAVAGAIREFWEETGFQLKEKDAFNNVKSKKYKNYDATIFTLVEKEFNAVYQHALQSLAAAKNVVAAIEHRTITQYGQIQQQFPTSPGSNELEEVRIFDLANTEDKMTLAAIWTATNKLDWYLEMAENYAGKF